MKKWFANWVPFPPDVAVQVSFPVVALVSVVVSTGFLLFLNLIKRVNPWSVFGVALIASVVGVTLLFNARLPLYRQGRFFNFGSRLLDPSHRRLYRLAYGFIVVAIVLLLLLLTVL